MIGWRYDGLECKASPKVFRERIRPKILEELEKKRSAETAANTALGDFGVTKESWDEARRIALDLVVEVRLKRFKW